MASIQFSRGVEEEVIPTVRLTRSRSGDQGTATFTFEKPKALMQAATDEITGMYLIDEDGEIVTREVKAKFVNGEPSALEAVYVMRSAQQWDRFMLFMERYSNEKGLEFSKS